MKKYFVFAAAALVALAACSKVETDETPAKKISFNAALYTAQTKADPGTNHSLNEAVADGGEGVTAFKSKAFLHADAGSGMTTQHMFGTTGETISYNSGVPEWAPANEYFWPKAASSYINFVSWYTTNDDFITPANVSETQMDWGTSGSPITITGTDNILFANEALGYKDNTNNGTTYANDAVTSGVPTLFHHALAKIAFNVLVKTANTSTGTIWDVDVQSATLKVGNNGYLALINNAPAQSGTITQSLSPWKVGTDYATGTEATSAIVGWARPASGATTENVAGTVLNFTNFAPYDNDHKASASQVLIAERTVMPQFIGEAGTPSNTYGAVTFTITFKLSLFHANASHQKNGSAFSEEVITISETNLFDLVSTIGNWCMNTKYVYNITIDPVGNKITFDPAVVDWYVPTATERQVYPTPAS